MEAGPGAECASGPGRAGPVRARPGPGQALIHGGRESGRLYRDIANFQNFGFFTKNIECFILLPLFKNGAKSRFGANSGFFRNLLIFRFYRVCRVYLGPIQSVWVK